MKINFEKRVPEVVHISYTTKTTKMKLRSKKKPAKPSTTTISEDEPIIQSKRGFCSILWCYRECCFLYG